MFRTPASVTPASLTPSEPAIPLTRTARVMRGIVWSALLVALLAGTALYFRFAPVIVPMVGER